MRAFGSDGEKALVDAVIHEFRFAIHLFCSIHVRRNVKNKLPERKFPENVANEITDDIFGKQVGSTYCEGLVDAQSEEVFYEKLEQKQVQWKKREEECTGCSTGFYDWFCQYQCDPIITGILRHIRVDAGLGVPPTAFSTNASESLNAVLKRKVDYKSNELPSFVEHLKELIDKQQRELERAVIGRDKYEFQQEYIFLEVREADWFRMTKQQREKHVQKIANVKLKCGSMDAEFDSTEPSSLSVTADQFHSGDLKVPLASVKGIWKKAEELDQPSAIVSAPGCERGNKEWKSSTSS